MSDRPKPGRSPRHFSQEQTPLHFSVHAWDQMKERGVSSDEVEAAVRQPEVQYGSGAPHPSHYRVHQRGSLAVVIEPLHRGIRIVTVLWREDRQWTSEEMRDQRSTD